MNQTYQLIVASCKVLYELDWIGNYTNLHTLTDKDIQYISQVKNANEYCKRLEEIVKDRILKNISDINNIKWNVKMFDENISFHIFIKEIGKKLEQFIKDTLTKKYPYYANHINKCNIDYNKTIIVEIFNNNEIIFVANLDIRPFI